MSAARGFAPLAMRALHVFLVALFGTAILAGLMTISFGVFYLSYAVSSLALSILGT
jgi:hypothetical protein